MRGLYTPLPNPRFIILLELDPIKVYNSEVFACSAVIFAREVSLLYLAIALVESLDNHIAPNEDTGPDNTDAHFKAADC